MYFIKNYEHFNTQIENNIVFLSIDSAKDIFNKKYPYINKFQKLDMISRVQNSGYKINKTDDIIKMRKKMLQIYLDSIENFSNIEKKSITIVINILIKKVEIFNKHNAIQLPIIKNWSFIKKGNTDWEYIFTTDKSIILSKSVIQDFVTHVNWYTSTKNLDNIDNIITTLYHEQWHIFQRLHQKIFDKFYKNFWNFIKVKLTPKTKNIIKKRAIINPDGDNFNWIYNLNKNSYILPFLGIDNDYEHHHYFLKLEKKNVKNEKKTYKIILNKFYNLDNNTEYTNRFYNLGQIYHPNEIFANLLPLILSKRIKLKNNDNKNIKNFLKNNWNLFT